MKVVLFVLILCGSTAAFLEDLFLEDPDFDADYDDYDDYDYGDEEEEGEEEVVVTTTVVPPTQPDFKMVEVEDTLILAPKECQLDNEVKQLRNQITSMKDDISSKITDLETHIRHNTASVTNVLDSMDMLAGMMNNLKELLNSGQVQEYTTIMPSTTRKGPVRCNSPFRREGGGCFYLEEFTKRTWSEAVEFCRNIGASLAEPDDLPRLSRHLHDTIGELGTRVRWPLWLGGQRLLPSGTDSWFWLKKETKIPSDVWEGAYLRDNWNCMALDGYNEYKPTSLNCDVRRRFLCEEKDSW